MVGIIRSIDVRYDGGEGDFLDFDIVDNSLRRQLRNWILTIDRESGKASGFLQRSETLEDPFDHDVELPRKMVQLLALHASVTLQSSDPVRASIIQQSLVS
jgi:hypothetical protein